PVYDHQSSPTTRHPSVHHRTHASRLSDELLCQGFVVLEGAITVEFINNQTGSSDNIVLEVRADTRRQIARREGLQCNSVVICVEYVIRPSVDLKAIGRATRPAVGFRESRPIKIAEDTLHKTFITPDNFFIHRIQRYFVQVRLIAASQQPEGYCHA